MHWALELLIRSTGLLVAAGLLHRLSEWQTAAFRHRFLLSAFALLALLPLFSLFLPEVYIPLWKPAQTPRAAVTAEELSAAPLPTSHHQHTNWPLLVWLTGTVLASAPMAAGAISAGRIARRAAPLPNPPPSLPQSKTEILVSRDLSIPLTCGFLRPRILLPLAATEWPASRLEAVLLHEIAHVHRRDIASQIAAHFIAALWWFQPLVWILRRKLRQESELACDAQAIQNGLRPSGYAAELLAIAKAIGRDYRFSSTTISMARSCDLEKRLSAILNPSAAPLRRSAIRTFGVSFAALAIAGSAAAPRLTNTLNPAGGSTMKRTLFSALLTSAGLSAATFSGTISDPSGTPIPDVHVLVYNPDTGAKQETTTAADGKFSLSGNVAGQYILRIEKPGLVSIFREFDLKADSTVARDFTMTNEGAPAVADKIISTNEEPSKRVRIGGMVMSENLLTKVQPVYPTAAKSAGTQGTVEIAISISKDGVPVELRVLSSPSDDLSQSALEAVRQWRYRPTLLNGAPVAVESNVIVNYTLAP